MGTAGLAHGLGKAFDLAPLPTKMSAKLADQLSFVEKAQRYAAHTFVNQASSTTMRLVLRQGPANHELLQGLKMASIMSVARPLAYGIGDLKYQGMIDSFTHKLLHGIVGGATGALVASSSRAGVNGALSAILAETFAENLIPDNPTVEQIQQTSALAQFMTACIAFAASQDVDVALLTANNALENNFRRLDNQTSREIAEVSKKAAPHLAKITRHALKKVMYLYKKTKLPRVNLVKYDWRKEFKIPKDWKQLPPKRQEGIRYQSPVKGDYNEVRIMEARPNSDFPAQRVRSVKIMKDGHYLDKFGNQVHKFDAESHIPIEDFNFDIGKLWKTTK